jgi:hypothetical protein
MNGDAVGADALRQVPVSDSSARTGWNRSPAVFPAPQLPHDEEKKVETEP